MVRNVDLLLVGNVDWLLIRNIALVIRQVLLIGILIGVESLISLLIVGVVGRGRILLISWNIWGLVVLSVASWLRVGVISVVVVVGGLVLKQWFLSGDDRVTIIVLI